ncbi:MAG TPA: DUF4185 domain-containing protein, partial [Polyangiales bacterium]|nr:DUF4185 domain-containing protein [Polyangiales bacterium]
DGPADSAVDGDGATPLDASASDGAVTDSGFDGGESPRDAGPTECPSVVDPANVQLSTMDLGAVPIPMWVSTRSLTGSAPVGDRVVWTFTVPGQRNMVAWSDGGEPGRTQPQLNEQAPFVPVLPASADPDPNPNLPIGISSIIGVNDSEALIFYSKLYILAPLAVGIARIARDQSQAEVVRPLDLFPPAEEPAPGTLAWRPLYEAGPIIEQTESGPLLYLYACHSNPNVQEENFGGLLVGPCRVGRVKLADVADYRAYRHWNGSDWVDDPVQAVPVLSGVPGGLTVSFNRYLGKYLAVYSGSADNVMLRSADRPEGPWATLGTFGTLPSDGTPGYSLAAAEHVALRDPCHRIIYVSYARVIGTTDETGAAVSLQESRMVRVELK